MRVLITGANGCIGSWIVKQLVDQGVDAITFDLDGDAVKIRRLLDPAAMSKVRVEAGRIEDTHRVKTLVRDGGITHIVHLAAVLMPVCAPHPVLGGMVNVIGTLNVFEAARDAGRPVRICYASSSAVWGPEDAYEDRKLTEADPLMPATHYGVFKQANEGNARVFFAADGISSVGLRPWAVYGYGRDQGLTADPTLAIRAAARKEPYHIRIGGRMDLQYVEDVAGIFIACLFAPKPGAYAFNLAGDLIETAAMPALLDRARPGSGELITAGGPAVPVAKRMDDAALRDYLGGIPETSLEEGVRRSFEMFETRPD